MSAPARIRHPDPLPPPPVPPSGLAAAAAASAPVRDDAVLVDVVVLTADLGLFQSTKEAVGERNPVWRARSAEEAADLLITGRCGVLLIDMASLSVRADTLIEQITEQFPDTVVCVAGTRDDEPLLAHLISDGLVYRFMHKPASARRAGMFLQAAIRRHAEHRGGRERDAVLPLLRSLARPSTGLPRKYLLLLALASAAVVSLLFWDGGPTPTADTPAPTAEPAPAPLAPHAATDRADPVLSRARAALQAGRLEAPEGRNALDLFEAVLLSQPELPEAKAGLARTIDLLLERAREQAATGHKAEAERLLQRVLAVEPQHAGAKALVQRVSPPDLPSRQLAREQVAEVRQRELEQAAAAMVNTRGAGTEGAATRTWDPKALPEPVSASFRTPTAQAPRTSAPATIVADPLAPRFVNTPPPKRVASWRRQPPATSAAAPPALPIAGEEASAVRDEPAAPVEPITGAAATIAADALDRVAGPDPVYPAEALRTRTRGWVELEFTIAPSGSVRDVQVVGAEPRGVFEAAATAALAQWQFRPRVVAGRAVAQRSTITLRFDVDG